MITRESFLWLFMALAFFFGMVTGAAWGIRETKKAYGTTYTNIFPKR
jgi:hypothetical protein